MARSYEQTKLKPHLLKSSSFAWDRAFFTSDGTLQNIKNFIFHIHGITSSLLLTFYAGVLDADELSSMIEGDGNDIKHQLQPIQEIGNLEAKLFDEMEKASTKKPNKIKTQSKRSTGNNVKSPATTARSNTSPKTGKTKTDSLSKAHLPSHLGFSNTSPRTSSPGSPISPGSSGSSSSTSFVNQRSPRRGSTSVPRRSSSANARRKDEQKPAKLSIITLKNKSPTVNSHPSSPLGLSSSSSSTSLASSISSSLRSKVNQRSASTGRGTTVHHRSLNRDASASSALKTRPRSQTPDQSIKQQAALYPRTKTTLFEDDNTRTGSRNGVKERKLPSTKAVQTGLKPNSQRSSSPGPCRVQSSGREKGSSSASKGVRNIFLVSPEILDIKGKLNALKMEINMQKKDKFKETKMVPVKIVVQEKMLNKTEKGNSRTSFDAKENDKQKE
ncbi:hypothetical protein L2E82_32578 [Cichorium intybus]|uniref:Uncharacterized protein n=1 Tax=Cichorium intybus TaxID=13427 RepID=A0ACB9BGR1_CICIN|nr:hypothetical protein L2E82_32578 [Cichorium intybus]